MNLVKFVAQILTIINKERKNNHLGTISYDYDLHNSLIEFRNIKGPAYFYEHGEINQSYLIGNEIRTNDLKGSYVDQDPFFSNKSFKYIYRDTYHKSILQIINFRNNQRDCYQSNKCSNISFNLFSTCSKYKIVLKDQTKCAYWYAYYPFHILPSLKSIAILDLNYQGIFVPDKLKNRQKKSFWVYGNYIQPKVDCFTC